MTGFLLDTNVLSVFSRSDVPAHPHVRRWVEMAQPDTLFTSVLTLGEIRKGIELLTPGRKRTELERWLDVELRQWFGTRLLPITHAISNRWGVFAAQAQKRGRPLGTIDGLLAATAFEHRLAVVTRNTRHFADTGVALIDHWEQ